MTETVWAQIDRLKREHEEEVKRTTEALAKRGWTGPEVTDAGLWVATLGHEAPHEDGEPIRVAARTPARLLRLVDEQRRLFRLAGLG